MVEIRDRLRDVIHELRHVRQLVVVDVLRLVRHLMVVAMIARREERDRDAVTRVHVMIAAAVVLVRMPRRDHYRSEEHTSELQSLRHLVCRLLLEKKKKLAQLPAEKNPIQTVTQ